MAAHVFRSTSHPRGLSAPAAYAAAVVRPLSACMLPIMVLTLVDVLRGASVVAYVSLAYPLALLVAAAVAAFRLRTQPAEMHVFEDGAAVRTVWDCLVGAPAPTGPVVDLRKSRDGFTVTIGHTTYEERDADWPDADALLERLRIARRAPLIV